MNILEELKNQKVTISGEDLLSIENILVEMNISSGKIVVEKNRIEQLTKEIKDILNSHE